MVIITMWWIWPWVHEYSVTCIEAQCSTNKHMSDPISDLVYVYNCNWNYRPDHCMYGNNCEAAKQEGISIIHGNRDVFHNDKQPFFKAVFESMRDYNLGEHMAYFVDALSNKLKRLETTYCGAMGDAVLVFPQKYVKHTWERILHNKELLYWKGCSWNIHQFYCLPFLGKWWTVKIGCLPVSLVRGMLWKWSK